MADEVKAAREFLKGLSSRERKPWDEPMSGYEAPRPAAKPAAKPSPKPAAKPRTTADDAADQVERITKRNKDFADRTKHLRGGSRGY